MHINFAEVSKFGTTTFCLLFTECRHPINHRRKFQCFLLFLKQNALTVLSFGYVKKQNLHCLQYAALSLPIIFITVCSNFLAFSLARKPSKNHILSIKNHMYFFNTESNSQCLGFLFHISFDIPFECCMKVLYGCKIFA